MTSGISKTCACGRRIDGPGARCETCKTSAWGAGVCLTCHQPTDGTSAFCDRCRPRPNEAARNARFSYRRVYADPEYKRNRLLRYELVGGRCETCNAPLKGDLHPDGASWQCDHHLEPQLFADPLDANALENLRCYCMAHHNAKTRLSRRTRKARR